MVILTEHSKTRLKERCGLNKDSLERIAEKAFLNGITHSETKGNLNKWITSLYFQNCAANNIRLYGDKAYLFTGNKLITIIQIPNNLLDAVHKINKKKKEDLIGENKQS